MYWQAKQGTVNRITEEDSNTHGDIQDTGNFKEHKQHASAFEPTFRADSGFIRQLRRVIQPAMMVNFDQEANNLLVLESERASKT